MAMHRPHPPAARSRRLVSSALEKLEGRQLLSAGQHGGGNHPSPPGSDDAAVVVNGTARDDVFRVEGNRASMGDRIRPTGTTTRTTG